MLVFRVLPAHDVRTRGGELDVAADMVAVCMRVDGRLSPGLLVSYL